jgi:hypothetical protein
MPKTPPKLFQPILRPFERGDEPFSYKPLNRKVLLAVGILFAILGAVATYFVVKLGGLAYSFPVLVFWGASVVCLVIAVYGSDRAVSKIWGNR